MQFPSMKKKVIVVLTSHRCIISLTTARLVPIIVRPAALVPMLDSLDPTSFPFQLSFASKLPNLVLNLVLLRSVSAPHTFALILTAPLAPREKAILLLEGAPLPITFEIKISFHPILLTRT